jgi:hypothetical protein
VSGEGVRITDAEHQTVLEALDETGHKYSIRVIQAGKSKNGNHYTDAALKQAVADRVFPAPAGMNRSLRRWPRPCCRVPHTRGDEPLDTPLYRTLGLLTANDVRQVKTLKGLDVGGYDYALDKSSVGHIKKKHGEAKVEEARGQRAVAAGDYARLPDLLNAPDNVEDGGVSDVGQPVLRYIKEYDGELYTVAFEVRKGRKMLGLQSLWIKKNP